MKIYFMLSLLLIVNSCKQKELRHENFIVNGDEFKSVAEVKEGKLNGTFKVYDKAGTMVEMSEWRNDLREGKTLSYFGNGKISGEYTYSKGKLVGEYKIYYETGEIKKVSNIGSAEYTYNTRSFDQSGNLFEMKSVFKVSEQVINIGDTVTIRATIDNVDDDRFLRGSIILGNSYYDDSKTFLKDTLAIEFSKNNDYYLKFVPEKTGDYDFIVEIVCYKNKSQDKVNSDSLIFFIQEGSIKVNEN
jgi:hypothetical protein